MYGKLVYDSLSEYELNELKSKNPKLDKDSYKLFVSLSNIKTGNKKINKVEKPSYKLLESHNITLSQYDSLYYFNDVYKESTLLYCVDKEYIHFNSVNWNKWKTLRYVYVLNGKYIVNGILKGEDYE